MDQIKEDKKIILGFFVIITIIVFVIGWGAFGALNPDSPEEIQRKADQAKKSQEEEKKREVEQAQIDSQVENHIANTIKIDGQKIKAINEDNIELENGVKLPIQDKTKNSCRLNDTIINYNKDIQSFICIDENSIPKEGGEDKKVEERSVYVQIPKEAPIQNNNSNSWLTGLIFWNYLQSSQYYASNGFSRNYNWDNRSVGYNSPTQRSYSTPITNSQSVNQSKPSINKSTPSTNTNDGSNGSSKSKSTNTSGFGGSNSSSGSKSGGS